MFGCSPWWVNLLSPKLGDVFSWSPDWWAGCGIEDVSLSKASAMSWPGNDMRWIGESHVTIAWHVDEAYVSITSTIHRVAMRWTAHFFSGGFYAPPKLACHES